MRKSNLAIFAEYLEQYRQYLPESSIEEIQKDLDYYPEKLIRYDLFVQGYFRLYIRYHNACEDFKNLLLDHKKDLIKYEKRISELKSRNKKLLKENNSLYRELGRI